MKRLYSADRVQSITCTYPIRQERPTILRAYPGQKRSARKIAENVYWWLLTRGKYRVWCAYDQKTIIHTSYVIPKCRKFPFLSDSAVEIGPCTTAETHRGRGIYAAVLSAILLDHKNAFLIIDDANTASIRGAAKAGFTALPGEIVRDRRKRYRHIGGDGL